MSPRRLSIRDRLQISDGLEGGTLDCGCVFGRYLKYGGTVLTVIDDASQCREGHSAGVVIDEALPGKPLPPHGSH